MAQHPEAVVLKHTSSQPSTSTVTNNLQHFRVTRPPTKQDVFAEKQQIIVGVGTGCACLALAIGLVVLGVVWLFSMNGFCEVQWSIPNETTDSVYRLFLGAINAGNREGYELESYWIEGDSANITCTYASRMLRFVDDISLEFEQINLTNSLAVNVHASSRSRLGKFDFGQNQKNLNGLIWRLHHGVVFEYSEVVVAGC